MLVANVNVKLERIRSEAFGKTSIDTTLIPTVTGTTTNNMRFPGQYEDQEMGTYYNYFRDYDPATAKYVQSDPIGLSGGINVYSYVNARVLIQHDFNGLSPSRCIDGSETILYMFTLPGKKRLVSERPTATGKQELYVTMRPFIKLFPSFIKLLKGKPRNVGAIAECKLFEWFDIVKGYEKTERLVMGGVCQKYDCEWTISPFHHEEDRVATWTESSKESRFVRGWGAEVAANIPVLGAIACKKGE